MAEKIEFDYLEIERLAAKGLSQQQIGAALGCSRKTLQRRLDDDPEFEMAFDRGRASLCEEAASLLLDQARAGSTDALKFVLDRRCDWSKTSKQELQIAPGPQIQLNFPLGFEQHAQGRTPA